MSEQNENAEPAFPTRRAMREAERAAARRAGGPLRPTATLLPAREAAPPLSITTTTPSESSTIAAAIAESVQAPTEPAIAEIVHAPAPPARPTRSRESGIARALKIDERRRTAARRWLPRVAVLGALGIATTAIPLSGIATPSGSVSSAAAFSATSALDVLDADSVNGTDVFDGSASLAADPLAAARAFVSTGRSESRDVLQCGSSALEANGQVAAGATTEPVEIMYPLAEGTYRLTSRFGYRWGGMHDGLDMAAPAGTPIHAVASGEVTYVGYGLQGRSGMIVVVEHVIDGQTFWTWYIHMYPDGIFVDVGQQVNAGDVIAEVGSYGNSTGPHLHLEVHLGTEENAVDPATWLAENHAAPLTAENLACAG